MPLHVLKRWVCRAAVNACVGPWLAICIGGCGPAPDRGLRDRSTSPDTGPWQFQQSGTTASLRGLSVVNDRIAWASGSGGTVLRTIDGGDTWTNASPPGHADSDFRDTQATDEKSAIILSAGRPAWLMSTTDGGANWSVDYYDSREGVFFDGMAFFTDGAGIAFGDPIGNRLQVLMTDRDGFWNRFNDELCPKTEKGTAGFAASGTSICVWGKSGVWIGLGGDSAQIVRLMGDENMWATTGTPLAHGMASRGVFSIAFCDADHGVAVGGDHEKPDLTTGNAAFTRDSGENWTAPKGASPRGYRSCVAWTGRSREFVTVGPNGTDVSDDGGESWRPLSNEGFHVVAFASPNVGWAAGADGRIAKWIPQENPP